MLSHDLAQELLARRNNDVRIQVLLDDDPDGETYQTCLVELRDQDPTIDPDLNGEPVVTYDHDGDVVVIRAGIVTLSNPLEAAGTWLDQAIERFGEPFIAIPDAVIRPGLNRRCWGWFVDGQNYNLAIDREDTGFRVTGGAPYRHARIWTSTEPTDSEIRSVLDLAWPGFRAVAE
jgi:hypothetical protein